MNFAPKSIQDLHDLIERSIELSKDRKLHETTRNYHDGKAAGMQIALHFIENHLTITK